TFGDVGVYGVAVKIATMITLLTTGIQMAWRPYSMNIKDEPNAKDIYAKVYYIILGIGIVGLLAIASVSPFIVQILAPQEGYREAANYVALLSLGSFLSFYYLIISVGLFLEEKTAIVSKYVGISAGISIVLNLLLIPYFKIWGATAALVISFVFVNIFIFKKSQEVYYVPVSIRKLVGVLINGCIGILAIVMIYINDLNIIFILIPWIYVFFSFYVMGFHKMALRMVRGG
ncbi:MAG TPA: polysaccharide biosynthesis C-terminal domain-containing protein, partial [Niallia sp.]|nr:polysaccharide biosynthesis C-terminal domain-containing protein [Niallia sp.]